MLGSASRKPELTLLGIVEFFYAVVLFKEFHAARALI